MKKLMLAILLYLGLVSSLAFAEDSATEQKVESSPMGQSFCGIRQHQDTPVKKEAGSIESLFEVDVFQSHFDKDCLVAVGFKGWANTWSLPIPQRNSNNEAYTQDMAALFKSATEFTAMPTLTFRYKNLYLSANHFMKTDYSFGTQKIDTLIGLPNSTVADLTGDGQSYIRPAPGSNSSVAIKAPLELSPTADRSEWDLTLGYYLNEYLAFTFGYKKIERNYQYLLHFPETTVQRWDAGTAKWSEPFPVGRIDGGIASSSKGSGVAIGILGAVPVRGKLSLYGNLVYGWLNTEVTSQLSKISQQGTQNLGGLQNIEEIANTIAPDPYKEYDTPYYSGEVGFAYQLAHFKEVGFSCYLGYRFQRYEFEETTASGQTSRDGTDGFIASISAYF